MTGSGQWKTARTLTLGPQSSTSFSFDAVNKSEWIRVVPERDGILSVSMAYADPANKDQSSPARFEGLASVKGQPAQGAVMYALPASRKLGLLSAEGTYYEMDSTLRIVPVTGSANQQLLKEKIAIPMPLIRIDGTSFLVTDNRGRRWRLPVRDTLQAVRMSQRQTRVVREVVTERDILHCGGTFFELPADNADGFAKVKPSASHAFAIHHFASYRGMLLMSGADPKSKARHDLRRRSWACRVGVWRGRGDDRCHMGRSPGQGGRWQYHA